MPASAWRSRPIAGIRPPAAQPPAGDTSGYWAGSAPGSSRPSSYRSQRCRSFCSLVEMPINRLGQLARNTFHGCEVADAGPRYSFGRSEGHQQGLLALGTYALDLVQRIDADG